MKAGVILAGILAAACRLRRGFSHPARRRRPLRARDPEHRLGHDERPRRGLGRHPSKGRRGRDLRRRRERRRLEIDRRRNDVHSEVRQGEGSVDRRDRARSERPRDRVGRDRRGLDEELGLDRRWDLPVRRRRRDLDPHGASRIRADRQGHRAPGEGRSGVRVRDGEALERLHGARRLSNGRRREDLGARPQRNERLDRMRLAVHGREKPRHDVRLALGLPEEGLDVPVGRRERRRRLGERSLPHRRRRRPLDRDHRGRKQGLAEEAVRTHRGGGGAVRFESRLRRRRVHGASALFRSSDGGATWERRDDSPADGLAAVLLRGAHRRSARSRTACSSRTAT